MKLWKKLFEAFPGGSKNEPATPQIIEQTLSTPSEGQWPLVWGEILSLACLDSVIGPSDRETRVVFAVPSKGDYKGYALEIHCPISSPAIHGEQARGWAPPEARRSLDTGLYSVELSDDRVVFLLRGLSLWEEQWLRQSGPCDYYKGFQGLPAVKSREGQLAAAPGETADHDARLQLLPGAYSLQMIALELRLERRKFSSGGDITNQTLMVPQAVTDFHLAADRTSVAKKLDGTALRPWDWRLWTDLLDEIGNVRSNTRRGEPLLFKSLSNIIMDHQPEKGIGARFVTHPERDKRRAPSKLGLGPS